MLNAVAAEVERSGALLLAEGIETEEHLARRAGLGATLGQGWLFGRPGRCHRAVPAPPATAAAAPASRSRAGTPFELIADQRRVRRGDKRLLLALSRQLEAEASRLGGEAVVLATFQDASFFTPRSRGRYAALAAAPPSSARSASASARARPVCAGPACTTMPFAASGTWRSSRPHFAGAFVARDLGDEGRTATAASTSSSPTSASSGPRGALADGPDRSRHLTTADGGESFSASRLQKRFW